jgi:acyl carrier protein
MNARDDTTIEETLAAYLREECLPRNSLVKVSYDQNLFEAGIVDSAGLISFIGFVETTFGLTVPDEDLLPENFMSLSAIARYIRARRAHV